MLAGHRIIIDASMVQGGGGFTFAVQALPRLARLAPQSRFRVFARNPRLIDSLPSIPNLEIILLPPPSMARRLRFTFIEAARLAREWEADLYLSLGEVAPVIRRIPVIAAFRNPNVFSRFEEGLTPLQKLRLLVLWALAQISARVCERVIFVSEDSARWIGDAMNLPQRKRAPIHHGIDVNAWRNATPVDRNGRPYILSVSSIYTYKNFVKLIEAYGELADRQPDVPDLVIIGDNQDQAYLERMEAARDATGEHAENIHILGEVPYAQVKHYYAGASLFVFPSYLETFGHPLLEAMASEVPLVASDIPVFREVAGDAAFYANPHDASSLARAMEEATFVPDAREALRKRASERVKRFTWERTVRRLARLLDEVLDPRPVPLRAPAATPLRIPAQALGLVAQAGVRMLTKH